MERDTEREGDVTSANPFDPCFFLIRIPRMATKLDEAVLLEGLAHFLDAPDAKLRVRHSC
jgi:hypothetical protein